MIASVIIENDFRFIQNDKDFDRINSFFAMKEFKI